MEKTSKIQILLFITKALNLSMQLLILGILKIKILSNKYCKKYFNYYSIFPSNFNHISPNFEILPGPGISQITPINNQKYKYFLLQPINI